MADVMLQMGDFAFSVSSAQYQKLTRKRQYRWGKRERLLLRSRQQFLGTEADAITLDGVLYPKKAKDLGQIPQMRLQGEKGEPFLLVSGNQKTGHFHGQWILESVMETNQHFLRDGTPLKIEFTLTISEYIDD